MAPIHQNRELDRSWSSEVHQTVEGGANGTSSEQHVIHEDGAPVGEREWYLRAFDFEMIMATPQIIAVEGDIDHAQRHSLSLDGADLLRQPPGEMNPTRPDTDKHQILTALIAFQNLMGDARQGPVDRHLIHHLGFHLEVRHNACLCSK